jgi:uncharacterized pyridoxal phosphate-containing UPF0001 family protein
VNTSAEESKGGVTPGSSVSSLASHIAASCPHLNLVGLMCIGSPGDSNDFRLLREERDRVETELGVKLELSMGMSGDYQEAIKAGSSSVRIGSSIFGARIKPV